jgi:hypothetical protein
MTLVQHNKHIEAQKMNIIIDDQVNEPIAASINFTWLSRII